MMDKYLLWTTDVAVSVLRSGIRIFIIVIITLLIYKAIRTLSRKMALLISRQELDEESVKRAETLGVVIRHTLSVIIFAVAIITILSELGIEIGPVLAAAGIAGIAVGFGAQSLIKDVINGFFILANDQIRVGDVIQAAGKSGTVEKVSLKMTVLRDVSGNVHFIPNGVIDIVTNMTKEFSQYVMDIGITYDQDVDRAIEAVKAVDESLRADADFKVDMLQPIELFGLERFAESSVVIRARLTTRPGQQWRLAREFNRRLKIEFDAKGIEFPFPTRTVYQVQDAN